MKLRERADKLLKNIDALTLRERLFVFAAMLMVLGALWESLLNAPLEARTIAAQNKVAATADRLRQLDEAIQIAAAGLDGGVGNRVEMLQSLREAVAEREQELRVFTSDLVDASQMRLVVEDLLKRQSGLELVSTRNLPAAPLLEVSADAAAEVAEEVPEEPNLYLHGLVIELEGSYLELLAYLESIEALPWQIYFGYLDLESIEHPRLKITLQLNTLSLEREWLGV